MKRTAKLALATVAALGLAAVALPVVADQAHHGAQAGGGMGAGTPMPAGAGMPGGGMTGGAMMGGGMMSGGMMGMMMGAAQTNVMAMFDTNKDGTLSPEEMTAGIKAELTKYDTDANGTLSLDEFAVMQAVRTRPMTVRAFQMHDSDGDGQVTEAEIAAMASMMQGHMSAMPGGLPRMGHGMMGNN